MSTENLHKDKTFVAVYGSLKRGFNNHHIIKETPFIGKGLTVNRYAMYNLGGFPFITKEEIGKVSVEVYDVTDPNILFNLDDLEGHPDFYCRERIEIDLDTGERVSAWIYFISNKKRYKAPLCKTLNNNFVW